MLALLTPGVDALAQDAFSAGFGIVELAAIGLFAFLIGFTMLRKLLAMVGL